jgi:ubiquinone biosynthesis accessory factor UbiJ
MDKKEFNWKIPAGTALTSVLNAALALDPESQDRLLQLDGRSVSLRLQKPDLAMSVSVQAGKLAVGPANDLADLTLSATPAALLAMRGLTKASAKDGKVLISGDAELARTVQNLLENYSPDFEHRLSQLVGDVAAHQIGKGVRELFAKAKFGFGRLAAQSVEYLNEESRDTVPAAELEIWIDDVDLLRNSVDRAAARLARLQTRRMP